MPLPWPERTAPILFHRKAHIDRDRLAMADKSAVAQKTVTIFDRLQMRLHKETSLLALACAFALTCKVYAITPSEALQASANLMRDPLRPEGISHSFAAMEMHLEDDYLHNH